MSFEVSKTVLARWHVGIWLFYCSLIVSSCVFFNLYFVW